LINLHQGASHEAASLVAFGEVTAEFVSEGVRDMMLIPSGDTIEQRTDFLNSPCGAVRPQLNRMWVYSLFNANPPFGPAERQNTRQRRTGAQRLVLATLDCLVVTHGNSCGQRLFVTFGFLFGYATLSDDLCFTDETCFRSLLSG